MDYHKNSSKINGIQNSYVVFDSRTTKQDLYSSFESGKEPPET